MTVHFSEGEVYGRFALMMCDEKRGDQRLRRALTSSAFSERVPMVMRRQF